MLYILYFLHVIICFFLILVVLLQQGKGADLSVFGGGGTMTAFGARGAATVLHKMTVISFVLFIVTTLTIGIVQGNRADTTVMDAVAIEEAAPVEEEAEAPAPASAFAGEDETAGGEESTGGAEAESGDAAGAEAPAEGENGDDPLERDPAGG